MRYQFAAFVLLGITGLGWGQVKVVPEPDCMVHLLGEIAIVDSFPAGGCVIRAPFCIGDCTPQPKPEAVDVPAVKIGKDCPADGIITGGGDRMCDYKTGHWVSCLGQSYNANLEACQNYDGKVWSCADKSRILLTAEDGKRWCHKVQAE